MNCASPPTATTSTDSTTSQASKWYRDEVNKMAELGTRIAYVDGASAPNIQITLPALQEKWLDSFIYFFEKAQAA